jgi:hypothetical protein
MNSVFIPYIPTGMTISGLKNALETHYYVNLIGLDMVQTPRGYMFFAHFVNNLYASDVAAIDATSQYKLTTGEQFFYVRRNTGTLDLTDPAVTQFLFYGDNTYSRGNDRAVYTLVHGEWRNEWLPQEVIDMFGGRTTAPLLPLPALIV